MENISGAVRATTRPASPLMARSASEGSRAGGDLAVSLAYLASRLSELGRADALPPAEEAVAIFRELAENNPVRYRRPILATRGFAGHCVPENSPGWTAGRSSQRP
jgi:hypothetical protein